MSAQIGEGLTSEHIVRGGHFWLFNLIASLATETTDGEILSSFFSDCFSSYRWGGSSSFFVPNMASEVITEWLILNVFPGEHAPRPP